MVENHGGNDLLDTTDCLEAVGVFRGWKNFLFLVVLLCLLLLQASFYLVDRGYIRIEGQVYGDESAVEPNEVVESAESVEPNEPNEVAEPNEPAEPVELEEPVEPNEPNEPAEADVAAEAGELADSNDPVEPNEPAEPDEAAGAGELADSNDPVESNEPAEPDETAGAGELTDSNDPVEPNEPAEPDEAIEAGELADPNDPEKLGESVQGDEPAEPNKAVEAVETSEPNEPAEPNKPVESSSILRRIEPRIRSTAPQFQYAGQWIPKDYFSKITFEQLGWMIRLVNAVLILTATLYCLTMLFSLKVSMNGRLGGINHISRAFFLSLLMLVILLPWQKMFGTVVSGAIFTPEELVNAYAGRTDDVLDVALYYLRFSGYGVLMLLLLILSQLRSLRWAKAILRRLEII